MKSNRYKATITLGTVSLGFLASYPFSHSFFGGLIASGCQAAMVGGLADWFAVTALFRKPLGIPFRTAIIPRNRERIFQALTDMVEQELLTKENIMSELERYNFAEFLIQYLEQHGGKEAVKAIIRRVVLDLLDKMDGEEIGLLLEELLVRNVDKVKAAPLAAQIMEWSLRSGYTDRLVSFILAELIRLAGQQAVREQLAVILSEAQRAYERDMTGRKLVAAVLAISPLQLAGLVQEKLIDCLQDMKNAHHPAREKITKWLEEAIVALKTDSGVQTKVEDWKMKLIHQVNISAQIISLVTFLRQTAGTRPVGEMLKLVKWLNWQIDRMIAGFKANNGQQASLDREIKSGLHTLVEQHHDQIGLTVKTGLNQFTNAMLVEFIEDKVGDDLQMIRINGSVVGGIAGMLIFLLTFFAHSV
ncbi:MAG: DUF445 domain-containing protein [Veillonellales bacterium]